MNQIFIDFYQKERRYNFCSSVRSEIAEHDVSLKNNGFLAFPWKRDSLSWMFKEFPDENFQWKEDIDHSITLVKPFNIYFVNCGNHRIACGKYFNKDGMLKCNTTIDYTNILREYDFDGEYFIDGNKKRINKPFHAEFVDMFILGKVIIGMQKIQ